MCGSSAPPPPAADPAIGQAALKQAQLGEQYLDYAKGQGEKQDALGREYLDFAKNQFKVSEAQQAEFNKIAKDTSDFYTGMAKEDRERWETVFKPLEDDFIKTANEFDTPEAQAEAAAGAKADVMTAAAQERGSTERREQALGIRPDSGRYAGVDRALGLGTTLASVNAQNTARDAIRDKGLALKGEAIGLGRGLTASAGANAGAGLNAAGQPLSQLNASQGIMAAGYGGALTGTQQQAATTAGGFTGAMSGQQGAASTLNTQRKTDVDIWDSQNKLAAANAQGIGQFAGTALGAMTSGGFKNSAAGLMFLSSKDTKENREPVPEGEALEAVTAMPIDEYDYRPGEGDGGHHVGPMAEDFQRATGHGDGKAIAAQDAIGIAMGAIKDLDKKVDRIAQAVGIGDARKPAPKNRAAALAA